MMYSFNLIPSIVRPTRIAKNSFTLIDNIFINNYANFAKAGIVMTNISDHYAVFSVFRRNSSQSGAYVEFNRRIAHRENLERLKNSFADNDFTPVLGNENAEASYNLFVDNVRLIYDAICPAKKVRIKRLDILKPYITSEIKELLRSKHKLQKMYNKRPITYGDEYRKLRNEVNSKIRVAKSLYLKSKLKDTRDAKASWKVVNSILGRDNKGTLPNCFNINGEMISDPLKIANTFNNFFSNIGESLSLNFVETDNFLGYLNNDIESRFSFTQVSLEQVVNIVMSMKDSSPGFDDIPMKLFKDNIAALGHCITHICNLSLRTGVFPKQLMIAVITCLYKAGDPHNIENYRSISILAAFSKILEKIVTVQVVEYFTNNNLFSSKQYAYRKGVSTSDAVLDIVNSLYDAFDVGETAVGVFLDLAKAFDSLNREILFRKLEYYGIGGIELMWFKSYFSDRRQYVKYKDVNSDILRVNYGVAQGSVLGPILYSIFVNDFVSSSTSLKFVMYADDTCVFRTDYNLNRNVYFINRELETVNRWLYDNCLTMNYEKSHYIIFHRKQRTIVDPNHHILINGIKLEKLDNIKYLGLCLDDTLSWKSHVSQLTRKVSKFMPMLYNVRNNVSREGLKLIYNSLIYPLLMYCNVVWGSCCQSYLNNLNTIQKKDY